MLIDSVFSLVLHHDGRAQRRPLRGYATTRVRAEVVGPLPGEPGPGGLRLRISMSASRDPNTNSPDEVEAVTVHIDLGEERLLAGELALAELPFERGAFVRLIGELEAWCYARLPIEPIEP